MSGAVTGSAKGSVARWRIAAAIFILAGMGLFAAIFIPIYFENLKLESFVSELTRGGQNQTKSDDWLRSRIVDKARELDLPVMADNVHIVRQGEGMDIDVRYFVRVDLPGYTVNLHFHPQASSR